MYQQQQQQVYYDNNNAQTTDYSSTKFRSNTSLYVSLCLDITDIILGITVVCGGGFGVFLSLPEFNKDLNRDGVYWERDGVADALEFGFVAFASISLILTIVNSVFDCILISQNPQSRGLNCANLGCSIAAGVTLFIGSAMLVGGSFQRCNNVNILTLSCHIVYSTWIKVPFGVIGLLTAFVYIGPITLAAKGQCASKQVANSAEQQDPGQFQQGPYDQPQGPSLNPSYTQQQQMYQQQPPDGNSPPYYADPNNPPSYQTY